MASDPILTLEGASVEKGDSRLLDGVSLALAPGRFHGLIGPNGAGKSTLMKVLYRAEAGYHGRIVVAGRELGDWPRRAYAARVGALVQEAVSLSGLSVVEVVDLGLLPLRLAPAAARARSRMALDLVGLAAQADTDAARLSGGEQQRLFFAQLLALDPEIYLLDEPHNHLDLHYQYALLDLIKARGKTVLASFHDLTLAARYCDTAFLLDGGRLVAEGALETVLTSERLATTYRVRGHYAQGRVHVEGPIL